MWAISVRHREGQSHKATAIFWRETRTEHERTRTVPTTDRLPALMTAGPNRPTPEPPQRWPPPQPMPAKQTITIRLRRLSHSHTNTDGARAFCCNAHRPICLQQQFASKAPPLCFDSSRSFNTSRHFFFYKSVSLPRLLAFLSSPRTTCIHRRQGVIRPPTELGLCTLWRGRLQTGGRVRLVSALDCKASQRP